MAPRPGEKLYDARVREIVEAMIRRLQALLDGHEPALFRQEREASAAAGARLGEVEGPLSSRRRHDEGRGEAHGGGSEGGEAAYSVRALGALITAKIGQSPLEYLEERLFTPMGMRFGGWNHDPAGNPIESDQAQGAVGPPHVRHRVERHARLADAGEALHGDALVEHAARRSA